ncbi:T9SS type A sorting domain-containing protein [bacterium]|nr:T9SS type A sorting domain-containing protein [bacterium]
MKGTFTLFLLVITSIAYTQPTISLNDIMPKIGDTFNLKPTIYQSPGDSGEHVTWNFSGATLTKGYPVKMVDPKSTSYSTDFSTSNVSIYNFGNYSFMNYSSGAQSLLGIVTSTNVKFTYSDPEDMLHFPLEYNGEYSDTWEASFVNGVQFTRKGISKVKVDGYGTLITPIDTYKNAMRVHTFQQYYDTSTAAGTLPYENDQYMWYVKGLSYPVLSIYKLATWQGTYSGAQFITSKAVTGMDVAPIEAKAIVFLYPNPSTTAVFLQLGNNSTKINGWTIYDFTGKELLRGKINAQVSSKMGIDVSALQQGMYALVVETTDGPQVLSFKKD